MTIDRRARGGLHGCPARGLLLREGLDEVAANANFRLGEIDLVMLDADAFGEATLVFVEVRYRADPDFGGARFPPTVWPSPEDEAAALARWSELGLKKSGE